MNGANATNHVAVGCKYENDIVTIHHPDTMETLARVTMSNQKCAMKTLVQVSCVILFKLLHSQVWRQDLPDGGRLGSLRGGLNKRIEGIFICIITQFTVENLPTYTIFFPTGG